jgi:BASS family bile acid:Na+ symporter
MQFLEVTFEPLVFVFAVSNLFYMGLHAKMPDVIAALKNKKAIALIVVWGWVLGPALAYLITMVLPLAEPYKITLLLSSLAPAAKYVPLMVEKARGDMGFTGALVPLVNVGTVVFMPLMAPLMVTGLTITAGDLAKPLLLSVFLPMMIGAAILHYAETAAQKILPAAKVVAQLTLYLILVYGIVVHGREMIATAGSFSLLSITIFIVGMATITYRFGFGLKQNQRSVMSLAMLSRNSAAILPVLFAIPNLDPRILTMTILWGVLQITLSPIAARIFAKQAGKTVAGHAPNVEADI